VAMVKKCNLNDFQLVNVEGDTTSIEDNSTKTKDEKIKVFFRQIKSNLIKEIKKSDIIVGCVAWLTDPDILEAMSKLKGVSIVVQKEDFLRPDLDSKRKGVNREELRKRYNHLKANLERFEFDNILPKISYCSNPIMESVRCVGHKRNFCTPLMHNKFIVFCKAKQIKEPNENLVARKIIPYAVWTGSFNFSLNSSASLENAIVIKNSKIAKAYYKEFGQIYAISEPLDWTAKYIEPTERIGS
jgi:phosphatidylserine/phosphatidylglycerophosphate/cardiolipin synthase-like enzyme